MTTAAHSKVASERDLLLLSQAFEALAEVQARIGPRFGRAEVRSRVHQFLEGLLAPVERKNGWQLAEALGERGPRGVQRLLGGSKWNDEAVRDDLRAYVLDHLRQETGILVVDETGFLKKGKKSAGVARQYSGTAGRRENCQIGVFLLYASPQGAAFIDRALYLPEEWTGDRVRCRAAGIPDAVSFATKGELAQRMLARAFAAGVRAAWVVGDTVYGYDELRSWLEARQQPSVLAVPATHPVWMHGRQQPIGLVAALLPQEAWTPLSAVEGSQGPRLYDWARTRDRGGVRAGSAGWLALLDADPAESLAAK
jgi:SRSO17 transposase